MSSAAKNAFVALAASFWAVMAHGQIGSAGWTAENPLKFHVQWPYNEPESSNYTVSAGVYHMLIYNTNASFESNSTTLPRSEQRFDPDYTNGEIHYQSQMMVPSDTSATCIFQIHTGDAQEDTFGSTTFMLFWYSTDNGSVHDYSGKELVKNLSGQWFQVNADHNLNTHLITIWINGNEVWQQVDNNAGDFYFKDGVYMQSGGSFIQENYVKNIQIWTNSGRGLPGFYEIQNASSGLVMEVRGVNPNAKGAVIAQASFTTNASQLWYFVPTSGGYYRIMSANSFQALTVQNASGSSGALMVQEPYAPGGASDWLPQQNSNTYTYTIKNRLSGLLLEDPDSSTTQNIQLDQKSASGGANQNWQLIPFGSLSTNFAVPMLGAVTNTARKLPLQLSGIPGVSYRLQAATNLTSPVNWQTIFTNTADTNGNWSYTDTNTALHSARFYRVFAP